MLQFAGSFVLAAQWAAANEEQPEIRPWQSLFIRNFVRGGL